MKHSLVNVHCHYLKNIWLLSLDKLLACIFSFLFFKVEFKPQNVLSVYYFIVTSKILNMKSFLFVNLESDLLIYYFLSHLTTLNTFKVCLFICQFEEYLHYWLHFFYFLFKKIILIFKWHSKSSIICLFSCVLGTELSPEVC